MTPRSEFKVGDRVKVQKDGEWAEGMVVGRGFHQTGLYLYLVRLDGCMWQVNRFGDELKKLEAQ